MQEEVETISTSTNKTLFLLAITVALAFTASSQDFYYNGEGSTFSNDNYFTVPEYESQAEIATELVAPFIFVTVLLHFAFSRAFLFILAEDNGDEIAYDSRGVPITFPMKDRGQGNRPNTSKYSMIMSLAITGSLVPTPYWGWIRQIMEALGAISTVAFAALFIFVLYMMAKVHG